MSRAPHKAKGTALTKTEIRALTGLLAGRTYREMGKEFNQATSTIATHIMWIRRKWGVKKATRSAILLEYMSRRGEVLAKALSLLGPECPGRSCSDETWSEWRTKCAEVFNENERTQLLS